MLKATINWSLPTVATLLMFMLCYMYLVCNKTECKSSNFPFVGLINYYVQCLAF